jgi:hypothetical protein
MVSCADWSHWTLALLQWTVEKLEDGNYHLSLEEAGLRFFIQGAGEDLIGSILPPPGVWSIRGQPGQYTLVPICLPLQYIISNIQNKFGRIEIPSNIWPSRAWTASRLEPKSRVRNIRR